MPKCRVIDPAFTWGRERKPQTAVGADGLLRDACRGFTMRHPAVPEESARHLLRPDAAEVVDYIASLGVTAVELLPIHAFVDDGYLLEKGLRNYWGYNSHRLLRARSRATWQRRLRRTSSRRWSPTSTMPGIEVILDVVYNHTAEGNELGPTLSFKGIDNASYYRLRRTTALLHQRHRHREHGQSQPSARAADGHRHPALLGAGDAGRRLPLRSRHHPRPRAARLRRGRRLPRRLPPGPGAEPGQADRRALGLRTRRLSGRAVPARLGGVERPVSRHRAGASGRATPGKLPELASRLTASGDIFNKRGRRPWASRQLHHRP